MPMPRRMLAMVTLGIAISLTAGLFWFALRNYRSAAPVAVDNLRGLALTIASAMEGVARRDPSLNSLSSFQTRDIAYAVVISPTGTILFHSNPDLIGHDAGDSRYRHVLAAGVFDEGWVVLGTGEQVYEFQAPFHPGAETSVLRLALHSWRSEAVMRRARFGITVILSLLAVGWGLGLVVFWLLRRQNAQELRLAHQNELERLGEVGAVLAHEVRNPLAGIKGYGQLLDERLPEGRDRGYARLIVREALRLEQLADDILFYTRTDSAPPVPGNVSTVAGHVASLLAPQAEATGIRLLVDCDDQVTVQCREESLHRLLLNLFTNAIQAMPDGGIINLAVRNHGSLVEISVADSGPGIDPDLKTVLFEPFRTSKARGAGLGLAVCRKITDRCGGSIAAGDAPGGGALFVVKLPAAQRGDKA